MRRYRQIVDAWIISVSLGLMAVVACVLLEALLAGCSAHRQTKAVTETATVLNATHSETRWHNVTAADTASRWTMLDSPWLTLQADSIVTAQGDVIYRPSITAGADSVCSKAETRRTSDDTTETAAADTIAAVTMTTSAEHTDTDVVAVASPPDGNGLWWVLCILALAAAAMALYMQSNKRN